VTIPLQNRNELRDAVDLVEKLLADLVHDWQTVPAEIQDRLITGCRAPLLRLLIQSRRRGYVRPKLRLWPRPKPRPRWS
jgi:hypothetical protein